MTEAQRSRGRFVVLDGVDGCGKTTQAERLVRALARPGAQPPLHLREPGSTAVGEALRAVLLDRAHAIDPGVETLLFAAARRQMLTELVEPALIAGRDVVCERFHPSTFAYQAVAGGEDEARVLALLGAWAGAPAPDLEVVLEVDIDLATARRGAGRDRIEDKGVDFQRAVAAGFRRYVELQPRAVAVDGGGAPDEVATRVRAVVEAAGRREEASRG